MNKKILLVIIITSAFLSSCLTSLHNLVTYENVVADHRVTGTWQYGELTVDIESIPISSFFKNLHSTTVTGGVAVPALKGDQSSVNAKIEGIGYDKKPVTFNGEARTSAKDSNQVIVNGEVWKSPYDSKEDSLLYSKSYLVSFTKNGYHFYMACCLTRIGNDIYADMEPLTAEPLDKPTATDINNLFDAGNYMSSHSIAKVIFRDNEVEFRILNGDFIKDQLSKGFAAIKYEADKLFGTTTITSSSAELRQFLSKYGNDERLYSPKNTVILKKIVS